MALASVLCWHRIARVHLEGESITGVCASGALYEGARRVCMPLMLPYPHDEGDSLLVRRQQFGCATAARAQDTQEGACRSVGLLPRA